MQTRALRFELANGTRQRAGSACRCSIDGEPTRRRRTTRIVARHYVVAGGAINSPALLLRSQRPTRTRCSARAPSCIRWCCRRPSSSSSRGLERRAADDLHRPLPRHRPDRRPDRLQARSAADASGDLRVDLAGLRRSSRPTLLRQFPHTHSLLALLRDGFHPQSPAARVGLRGDGSPVLDYPLNDFVMDGARRALAQHGRDPVRRRRAHGDAGARAGAPATRAGPQARDAIAALPMKPLLTRVVSAHVMGGCGMAGDERHGVVRPDGRHWQVDNLSVHDGSLFPDQHRRQSAAVDLRPGQPAAPTARWPR